MKTHELKLDIKYFNDVKSGKKNFEIRKNDRDFRVGDILELKAYVKGLKSFAKWGEIIDPFNNFRMSHNYMTCAEEEADAIKVKVTCVLSPLEVNEGIDFMNFKPEVSLFEDEALPFVKAGWRNDWNYEYFLKVLKDYFHTYRLPDGYVTLGIEVVK